LFIVVEGIDGSGKSTQIEYLKEHFMQKGLQVMVTREPGGTAIGEQIRAILLDPDNRKMDPVAEMFLYAASRAQHIKELIGKCLEDGVHVICDRFVLSSYVYQGIARGIGLDTVKMVNGIAVAGIDPDITFFIDIDNEESFQRRAKRNIQDRMEKEDRAFHMKVCDGYRKLIRDMDNIVTVNGMQKPCDIAKELIRHVDTALGKCVAGHS